MGSVQRLANGNTLIGWGLCDSAAVTEVKPDGTTVLELRLPIGHYNYRAYKFTEEELKNFHSGISLQKLPGFTLEQNYPNPFNTSSTIDFTTDERMPVSLIIYDALGRKVKRLFDGTVDAGKYSAKLGAGNLPNGIYICKLSTPAGSLSRTMILAK